MSRPMWLGIGIGGTILGLILLSALPWWVPVLIIAAAIAIPVIGWRSLDQSQRRRIKNMRDRRQLGR
jgi:hypothetical protein